LIFIEKTKVDKAIFKFSYFSFKTEKDMKIKKIIVTPLAEGKPWS